MPHTTTPTTTPARKRNLFPWQRRHGKVAAFTEALERERPARVPHVPIPPARRKAPSGTPSRPLSRSGTGTGTGTKVSIPPERVAELTRIDPEALKRHYSKGGTLSEYMRGEVRNPGKKASELAKGFRHSVLHGYELATSPYDYVSGRFKQVLRNPGPSIDDVRQLVRQAETARSAEELHRLWNFGHGHNFPDVKSAAEYRMRQLRIPLVMNRSADAPKSKSGKRNPDGGTEADTLYESFHGRPADKTLEVEERVHVEEDLAPLGVFVNLVVHTLSGYEATIGLSGKEAGKQDFDEMSAGPDTIFLAANPDGTQLYLTGGDQSIDLASIHMTGKYVRSDMIIGELVEITYRTRKAFDRFKLTDYYHTLAEETGPQDRPMLRYEPKSPKMYISGGAYKIKMPLVGMSDGIEN